jgi:hypothetical protein
MRNAPAGHLSVSVPLIEPVLYDRTRYENAQSVMVICINDTDGASEIFRSQ